MAQFNEDNGTTAGKASNEAATGTAAENGRVSDNAPSGANRALLDWAVELQSLAQAGLAYCKDPYDRERYQSIRDIAASMLALQSDLPVEKIKGLFCNEIGYQTPKLDTRAAIFEGDRILLVRENDGLWSLPGGWVDVNQSVRANTVKEAKEESGLDVTADRVIAIQDRAKHNLPPFAFGICKIFVLCTRVGGRFEPNTETTESRYFGEDELPALSESKNTAEQIAMCFAAKRDPNWVTLFE